MRHDIPANPNPFLTHLLVDPDTMGEGVMWKVGNHAVDLYRAVVAKDSGGLAASARAQLVIGGEKFDRICVDVIIGEDLPRGGYGASHEFGIGIHPRSRVPPTPWMPQRPVDDFVKVLAIMNSLP